MRKIKARFTKVAGFTRGCAIESTLAMLSGSWKGVLLYFLLDGDYRFNELRRMLPHVTQRVLTLQLRELEADGLVRRTVYAEIPPRVEYSLTERGRSLEPVLTSLYAWGMQNNCPIQLIEPEEPGLSASSSS